MVVRRPHDMKVGAQDVHRWIQDMGWDFQAILNC